MSHRKTPTLPFLNRRKSEATVEEKFAVREWAWKTHDGIPKTFHRVYQADARQMEPLDKEECIHLVVTSPPYWTLKPYPSPATTGQLGSVQDFIDFCGQLKRVWQRCFDVLVPGGRLCVVVGDVCLPRRRAGRHLVMPLHAEIINSCRAVGFDYLSPIFWYKIANAATEVRGNGATFLGKPYEPNAVIKNDVEYILLLRKAGGYRHPSPQQRNLSVLSKKDHERWCRQVWADVPGESTRYHPAPFPEEIPRRLISMFSFVGDVVLDPFWGLGNTTRAAIKLHRSSIGFEIEPQYIEIAKSRFPNLVEFLA